MKEKIVFFGAGPYVGQIIEILGESFDIVRIVKSDEILDQKLFDDLKSSGARVAVLASFGKIIPDKLLNLFEFGIINLHPSLLPKYRGTTPIQSAIYAGEKITGISIMKLDTEMDHGPILAQIQEEIKPEDTSQSLYLRTFKLGAEALVEILPKYISGELKPTEQDHSQATYTKPLTRDSGFIDINEPPTPNRQLQNMIRAYYPWPGVWFKFRSKIKDQGSKLDGKIIKLLPENKIQVEGKNIMSYKDFANGYPEGNEIINKLGLT